jgi:hypothetical protein
MLLGKELATLTSPDQVLGVSQGGGLVEAQTVGLFHQICGGCVVAKFATMDLV